MMKNEIEEKAARLLESLAGTPEEKMLQLEAMRVVAQLKLARIDAEIAALGGAE